MTSVALTTRSLEPEVYGPAHADADGIGVVARRVAELRLSRVSPGTACRSFDVVQRYAATRLADEPVALISTPGRPARLTESRLRLLFGEIPTAATMQWIYREHDDRIPAHIFAELVSDNALAALAILIADGPRRSTRRLEVLQLDLLNDPTFRPRRGRRGQRGRAGETLKHTRNSLHALRLLLVELHGAYTDMQRPAALRQWHSSGQMPAHPEGAVGRREDAPTPSLRVVQGVIADLDQRLAEPFQRRFGISDLEYAARDRHEIPGKWLRYQGLIYLARDRAMVAVAAVLGTRGGAIRSLTVGDFEPNYRLEAPITGFSPGAIGALRIRGMKGSPDRTKILPPPVNARVQAWLMIHRAALTAYGIELRPDHPLFPARSLTHNGRPIEPRPYSIHAFYQRLGGHPAGPGRLSTVALVPLDIRAVGKTANELHLANPDVDADELWRGPGPHGLRRFADRTVYDYADRYFVASPDMRRISPVSLKEALLDHSNIGEDPLGYTGIADEAARRILSCVAAHIVADAIWADLAMRRGPDERHLREALMAVKGLRSILADATIELAEFDEHVRNLPADAPLTVRDLHKRTMLADRVTELQHDINRWERRAEQLSETGNWIPIPDDVERIDPRVLRHEILEPAQAQAPPIRDWLTGNELAEVFGKSTETVRRWTQANGSDYSRPWPVDKPPIVRLDRRTALYWVPGLLADHVTKNDRPKRISELLRRWPVGPSWSTNSRKRTRMQSQAAPPLPDHARPLNSLIREKPTHPLLRPMT